MAMKKKNITENNYRHYGLFLVQNPNLSSADQCPLERLLTVEGFFFTCTELKKYVSILFKVPDNK